VQRVSQRLGWTRNGAPAQIEQDLCKLLPPEDWDRTSHILIFHGRRICFARKPACAECGVSDACPSAFAAENVGRKAPRARGAAAVPAKKAAKKAAAKAIVVKRVTKAK